MKPIISVVVPTCGRVDLLRYTLASLEVQTLRSFQLILTDDSPREADRREIERLARHFRDSARIDTKYVFSRPQLYQAANTNQGLLASDAGLIRILHSDDLLRPDALAYECNLFARFSQAELLFEDCIPFVDQIAWQAEPRLTLVSAAYHLRTQLSHATALPSGLVFTRRLLDQAGPMRNDLRFLCDWEFFFRLLVEQIRANQLVLRLSPGLFGWRTHADSVTGKLWKTHFDEHESVSSEFLEHEELNRLGVFAHPEKEAFAAAASRYRYDRLKSDHRKLPPARRWKDATWFLAKFIGRQAGRRELSGAVSREWQRLLRRWRLRKQPAPKAPEVAPSNAEVQQRSFGTLAHNRGILAIMPFYDGQIMSTHDHVVLCEFDNLMNLSPHTHELRQARKVRLYYPNFTRMYEKALHETLKYVALGQRVEILLSGNDHLQWFGLKAAVDQLFPGEFQLVDQEKIAGDFYRLGFDRVQPPARHLLGEHTGWTFGLLAQGMHRDRVDGYLNSISRACSGPHETLVVAPCELDYLVGRPHVRQIVFSDRDDLGWITRKKNLICQQAQFSDILICHDRFELAPDFCRHNHAWGYSYGLAAPRVQLPDGRRGLDWGVVSSQNHTWSCGGLLDYRSYSRYAYVPGGATQLRKAFWEKYPWDENLFWNEHEDVELCRRAQRHGEIIALAPGRLITSNDRWIDQNPLIPYDPNTEFLYGSPVGEQRLVFQPMPQKRAA